MNQKKQEQTQTTGSRWGVVTLWAMALLLLGASGVSMYVGLTYPCTNRATTTGQVLSVDCKSGIGGSLSCDATYTYSVGEWSFMGQDAASTTAGAIVDVHYCVGMPELSGLRDVRTATYVGIGLLVPSTLLLAYLVGRYIADRKRRRTRISNVALNQSKSAPIDV
jgi:hypothetical protein